MYLLTMNVSNGECDFSSKLFLVKLHSDDFVRKPFVEEAIYFGAAAQLEGVDHGGPAALDGPLKVLLQLLDAPENRKQTRVNFIWALTNDVFVLTNLKKIFAKLNKDFNLVDENSRRQIVDLKKSN
jgi:hypothetical protein